MILITGAKGQLGYDIVKECTLKGLSFMATDSQDLDITDEHAVQNFFLAYPIKAVIHCAAYTAVDAAEDQRELCFKVNVEGTKNLAIECAKRDIKLLFVSTDYVFDGQKEGFYETTDHVNPIGIYAQSKAEGEKIVTQRVRQHFVVRISWVFGLNGKNFVKTMLRIGKDKDSVNVVADQFGSPTYTYDVAKTMVDIIESEKYGVYHATNEGECSWAQFAETIYDLAGYTTQVNFIKTSDYPTKAQRPNNSKLSKQSLLDSGFKPLPHWKDALKRYIIELKEHGEIA